MPCGYKVELRRDGGATFTGEPAARRKGAYRGSVRPEQFEKLAELITGQGFFSLPDRINSGRTDSHSIRLSVLHATGVKTVENFNGGEKLSGIGAAVDELAGQIAWRKD